MPKRIGNQMTLMHGVAIGKKVRQRFRLVQNLLLIILDLHKTIFLNARVTRLVTLI